VAEDHAGRAFEAFIEATVGSPNIAAMSRRRWNITRPLARGLRIERTSCFAEQRIKAGARSRAAEATEVTGAEKSGAPAVHPTDASMPGPACLLHPHERNRMKRTVIAAAVIAAATAGIATAQQGPKPEDEIRYRQSVMNVVGRAMGPMGAMAQGKAPFTRRRAEERALIDSLLA